MADVIRQPARLVGWVTSSEKEGRWQHKHKHKESPHRPIGLLWKEFFRDPSQWLDTRSSKAGPSYPHFIHKVTKEPLWTDGCRNPTWVREELDRRGITAPLCRHHTELCCEDNEKFTHYKALLCNDDGAAFVVALRACAKNKDLSKGIRLHDDILKRGLVSKCSDALVTMYAKCGALAKAKDLLDRHKSRDVITWTALISAYTRQGQSDEALRLFELMKQEGLYPDSVTFTCILKACGSIKAAEKGKQFHDEIARQGLLATDVVLGNALVDMYAKCGDLAKAHRVLAELPSRDVVSWNTLITGYAQDGRAEQALNCFEQMQQEGLSPDAVTFACILKACGTIGAIDKGKQIHDEVAKQGLLRNSIVLGTALVDMYAKCGALVKAQRVLEDLPFRDVVSWNALISGYIQQGQGAQALNCFEQMQAEGVFPDAVTFGCILKACSITGAVDKGELIHDEIARNGLLGNNSVLGTALIDMYAKCGALSKARQLLQELPFRSVVAWSALIAGYVQQGQGEQALHCFEQMQHEGLSPDAVTFSCILKACGIIGAVDKGGQIHDEIVRQGLLGNDMVLGSALVDMYAKCGALYKAQQALQELPSRDVVSWSALIAGYAQQGHSEQALSCFKQMQFEGFTPDASTFSSVLTSCCHLGLVEDGHQCFLNMSTKYGVQPDLEHYTCIVDLFGRAGHLYKAARLIQEMPFSDHSAVLSALLGACRKWGDVNVGRWAFEKAVQEDKSDGAAYVLMADIYAAAGMQEDAENIEAMRMENTVWKKHARLNQMKQARGNAFSVGDAQHAQSKVVYTKTL